MNAAQKAAELGMSDYYADRDRWTDSVAYQNYMTGYQSINREPTMPPATQHLNQSLIQQSFTQEQVQQMINNALAGFSGQYNTLQSQLRKGRPLWNTSP